MILLGVKLPSITSTFNSNRLELNTRYKESISSKSAKLFSFMVGFNDMCRILHIFSFCWHEARTLLNPQSDLRISSKSILKFLTFIWFLAMVIGLLPGEYVLTHI